MVRPPMGGISVCFGVCYDICFGIWFGVCFGVCTHAWYVQVTRPILGISFAPDQSSEPLGVKGILVLSAREGGPAWKSGVKVCRPSM